MRNLDCICIQLRFDVFVSFVLFCYVNVSEYLYAMLFAMQIDVYSIVWQWNIACENEKKNNQKKTVPLLAIQHGIHLILQWPWIIFEFESHFNYLNLQFHINQPSNGWVILECCIWPEKLFIFQFGWMKLYSHSGYAQILLFRIVNKFWLCKECIQSCERP